MAFPHRQRMRLSRLLKQLMQLHAFIPPLPSTLLLLSTAMVVGVVAGLGAMLFRELTTQLVHLSFTTGQPILAWSGVPSRFLMPTLGGVVIGLLLYRHAQETIGWGLDEVVESVVRWSGRLGLLRMLKKTAAAAICMGTGGSVGREEPIAQLGAALGSAIGQQLRLPEDWLRYLVASGSAGGLAVALHAPIAAVFFALEVVLAEYSTVAISSTVVASVSASMIASLAGYRGPVIPVPAFALISSWELPLYAVLGGLAAIASLAFVVIFCLVDILFAAWDCPVDLKPMIGGLLIGLLGLYVPQVLGGGYDTLTEVLQSQFPLNLTIMLIAAKILTTSITLGAGGVGGVLAPSLLIGALLGGSFGHVAHHLWPALTAAPSAYALVGMASVLAMTTGAPLTAGLLVLEFTGHVHILMPLLLATGMGLFLAQCIQGTPLYRVALWRHDVHRRPQNAHDPISQMIVAQVMTTQVPTVPTTMELAKLAWVFERWGLQAVLVMEPHGALYGLLSLADLKQALMGEATGRLTAGDIATATVARVYPDEFVSVVVNCMASSDLWCLPVVDRSQPPRLLGVVSREDLNRVYDIDGRRTGYNTENS
jgi:CIC family chloride channel protein